MCSVLCKNSLLYYKIYHVLKILQIKGILGVETHYKFSWALSLSKLLKIV